MPRSNPSNHPSAAVKMEPEESNPTEELLLTERIDRSNEPPNSDRIVELNRHLNAIHQERKHRHQQKSIASSSADTDHISQMLQRQNLDATSAAGAIDASSASTSAREEKNKSDTSSLSSSNDTSSADPIDGSDEEANKDGDNAAASQSEEDGQERDAAEDQHVEDDDAQDEEAQNDNAPSDVDDPKPIAPMRPNKAGKSLMDMHNKSSAQYKRDLANWTRGQAQKSKSNVASSIVSGSSSTFTTSSAPLHPSAPKSTSSDEHSKYRGVNQQVPPLPNSTSSASSSASSSSAIGSSNSNYRAGHFCLPRPPPSYSLHPTYLSAAGSIVSGSSAQNSTRPMLATSAPLLPSAPKSTSSVDNMFSQYFASHPLPPPHSSSFAAASSANQQGPRLLMNPLPPLPTMNPSMNPPPALPSMNPSMNLPPALPSSSAAAASSSAPLPASSMADDPASKAPDDEDAKKNGAAASPPSEDVPMTDALVISPRVTRSSAKSVDSYKSDQFIIFKHHELNVYRKLYCTLRLHLIKRCDLFPVDIEGDGNCFYRSVNVAAGLPDSFANVKAMRSKLADILRHLLAAGEISNAVFADTGESYEQRIEQMLHAGRGNAWGGAEDIPAVVALLARPVAVHFITESGAIPEPMHFGVEDSAAAYVTNPEPIHLLYINSHFEAVLHRAQYFSMPPRVPNTVSEEEEIKTRPPSARRLKCALEACTSIAHRGKRYCNKHESNTQVGAGAVSVHQALMAALAILSRSGPIEASDQTSDAETPEFDQLCNVVRQAASAACAPAAAAAASSVGASHQLSLMPIIAHPIIDVSSEAADQQIEAENEDQVSSSSRSIFAAEDDDLMSTTTRNEPIIIDVDDDDSMPTTTRNEPIIIAADDDDLMSTTTRSEPIIIDVDSDRESAAPTVASTVTSTSTTARRRGRPPGSKAKPKVKQEPTIAAAKVERASTRRASFEQPTRRSSSIAQDMGAPHIPSALLQANRTEIQQRFAINREDMDDDERDEYDFVAQKIHMAADICQHCSIIGGCVTKLHQLFLCLTAANDPTSINYHRTVTNHRNARCNGNCPGHTLNPAFSARLRDLRQFGCTHCGADYSVNDVFGFNAHLKGGHGCNATYRSAQNEDGAVDIREVILCDCARGLGSRQVEIVELLPNFANLAAQAASYNMERRQDNAQLFSVVEDAVDIATNESIDITIREHEHTREFTREVVEGAKSAMVDSVKESTASVIISNNKNTASVIISNNTNTASVINSNNTNTASVINSNNKNTASVINSNNTNTGIISTNIARASGAHMLHTNNATALTHARIDHLQSSHSKMSHSISQSQSQVQLQLQDIYRVLSRLPDVVASAVSAAAVGNSDNPTSADCNRLIDAVSAATKVAQQQEKASALLKQQNVVSQRALVEANKTATVNADSISTLAQQQADLSAAVARTNIDNTRGLLLDLAAAQMETDEAVRMRQEMESEQVRDHNPSIDDTALRLRLRQAMSNQSYEAVRDLINIDEDLQLAVGARTMIQPCYIRSTHAPSARAVIAGLSTTLFDLLIRIGAQYNFLPLQTRQRISDMLRAVVESADNITKTNNIGLKASSSDGAKQIRNKYKNTLPLTLSVNMGPLDLGLISAAFQGDIAFLVIETVRDAESRGLDSAVNYPTVTFIQHRVDADPRVAPLAEPLAVVCVHFLEISSWSGSQSNHSSSYQLLQEFHANRASLSHPGVQRDMISVEFARREYGNGWRSQLASRFAHVVKESSGRWIHFLDRPVPIREHARLLASNIASMTPAMRKALERSRIPALPLSLASNSLVARSSLGELPTISTAMIPYAEHHVSLSQHIADHLMHGQPHTYDTPTPRIARSLLIKFRSAGGQSTPQSSDGTIASPFISTGCWDFEQRSDDEMNEREPRVTTFNRAQFLSDRAHSCVHVSSATDRRYSHYWQ